MREQFEILYVKCVLKPVITRIKHFDQLENEVKQTQDDAQKDALDLQLSDEEEADKEDNAVVVSANTQKKSTSRLDAKQAMIQEDNQFQMGLHFLQEVLLSIRPQDLGLLFLIYDCQHFAESIVTKSINLLLRYTRRDERSHALMFNNLFKGLVQMKDEDLQEINSQSVHVTHQRLKYMLD